MSGCIQIFAARVLTEIEIDQVAGGDICLSTPSVCQSPNGVIVDDTDYTGPGCPKEKDELVG
jgi:hypothetical protein